MREKEKPDSDGNHESFIRLQNTMEFLKAHIGNAV